MSYDFPDAPVSSLPLAGGFTLAAVVLALIVVVGLLATMVEEVRWRQLRSILRSRNQHTARHRPSDAKAPRG